VSEYNSKKIKIKFRKFKREETMRNKIMVRIITLVTINILFAIY
jgi:hypothetical protein